MLRYSIRHFAMGLLAALLFCCLSGALGWLFRASPAFARAAYEAVDQHLYSGGQPSLMTEAGKGRISAGIAAMKKSGLYQVIIDLYGPIDEVNGGGSQESALMLAIVVRESTGILNAINQGSKAACAHQIIPDNINVWYKEAKFASPAAFTQALMTDPALCHKWGRKAYTDQMGFATKIYKKTGDAALDHALCGYAAELKMLEQQGFCWASDEYKLTAARILKQDFSYVYTDKESGKFAQKVTIDKKTGKVLATEFLCKDHTQEFPLAIAKMADAYQVTRAQVQQDTFVNSASQYDKSGTRVHLPPDKSAASGCMKKYEVMFKKIQDSQGKNSFEEFARDFLKDFMESACSYVSSQAEILANNLLNLACVPMPDLSFGFGFDLPSLESTTCDGVSLSTFYSLSTESLTRQEIDAGLSKLFPKGTVPAYESMPTEIGGSPLPLPTLKFRMERSGGVYEFF